MYRKDGKAIVLPEGYPVYLQEQSKKCYTLKSSSQYCIDGAAEYGSPNPFNNEPGEIFLVTCSEYLFEPPVQSYYINILFHFSFSTSPPSHFQFYIIYFIFERQNLHKHSIFHVQFQKKASCFVYAG